MKAIVHDTYGEADVLELRDIPMPEVGARPAVPTSGFTALEAVRDKGEVTAGQHVLVVGASGGVGSFAVQIAKALGAVVTGVASGTKLDMVRSIGADHVIDYGLEDFTESDQRYDVIIDTGGAGRGLRAIALSPFVKHTLRNFIAGNKTEDLLTLKDLIEAGDVTPVVDKTFPLSAAADAIRYMTDGRATGKIVVTI